MAENSINSADNKIFDIKDHLRGLISDYCPNMPSKAKKSLFGRIKKSKTYKVPELTSYPSDSKGYADAYSKNSMQHIAGSAITNELLEELQNAGSKSGSDLKALLGNSELTIGIRTKFDMPNASVAFQRATKEGEKNKIFLSVSDSMFTDKNIEMFPELLAHEMSHLLDLNKRSGGFNDYLDEAESVMDVIGQDMAGKAGYSSKPWGKFMGEHFQATKRKFKYSPDGGFREKMINLCEKETYPTPSKKAKDLKSYKDNKKYFNRETSEKPSISERLASLRKSIAGKKDTPQELKAPHKPRQDISKTDFNTLRVCQSKRQNG